MAPQDTTVILVPGAFHLPECFDYVIAHLDKAGYRTSKVTTPSVLKDGGAPLQDFSQDVAEVKKHLTTAVDAGQKVVLVMHSYGGLPGTQACEGFDQASQAAQGHTDGRGIVHLVYIASILLKAGDNITSIIDVSALDWIEIRADTSVVAKTPGHIFYNDFESQEEVDRWAANLHPWSLMCMMGTLTHEPWRTIPAIYMSCRKDNSINFMQQKDLINRVTEAGAIDLKEVEMDTGHTPFGVKPLEVSQLIRKAAGETLAVPEEKISAQVEVSAVEIVQ